MFIFGWPVQLARAKGECLEILSFTSSRDNGIGYRVVRRHGFAHADGPTSGPTH